MRDPHTSYMHIEHAVVASSSELSTFRRRWLKVVWSGEFELIYSDDGRTTGGRRPDDGRTTGPI